MCIRDSDLSDLSDRGFSPKAPFSLCVVFVMRLIRCRMSVFPGANGSYHPEFSVDPWWNVKTRSDINIRRKRIVFCCVDGSVADLQNAMLPIVNGTVCRPTVLYSVQLVFRLYSVFRSFVVF